MKAPFAAAVVLSFCCSAADAVLPPGELAALSDFYQATGGAGWTGIPAGQKWFSAAVGSDPCAMPWFGLTCSPDHTRVWAIRLQGHGLDGSLPPSFGNFSDLIDLDLAANPKLSGPVPTNIGNTNLETFSTDDTRLGCLEGGGRQDIGWIRDLPLLKAIRLRSNCFGGVFADLPPWPDLRVLVLEGTGVSGDLGGLGLDSKALLEVLNITRCGFTGPIPDALPESLTDLLLDQNELSGPLPASLSNLASLEELNIGANRLIGPVPDLTSLAALKRLKIGRGQLSGPLGFAAEAPNLELLSIEANRFSGLLPASLQGLASLTKVELDWNGLEAETPDLEAFLLARSGADFRETQTIPPTNVSAVALNLTKVLVTWEPIRFVSQEGFYEVFGIYGGARRSLGRTLDKAQRTLLLTPELGRPDAVEMVAVTLPHAANQNGVESQPSVRVAVQPGTDGESRVEWLSNSVPLLESSGYQLTLVRRGDATGALRVRVAATAGGGLDPARDLVFGNQAAFNWVAGASGPRTVEIQAIEDGRIEGTEAATLELTVVAGVARLPEVTSVTVSDRQVTGSGLTGPISNVGFDVVGAADGEGNQLIAWIESVFTNVGSSQQIFAQALDRLGRPVGQVGVGGPGTETGKQRVPDLGKPVRKVAIEFDGEPRLFAVLSWEDGTPQGGAVVLACVETRRGESAAEASGRCKPAQKIGGGEVETSPQAIARLSAHNGLLAAWREGERVLARRILMGTPRVLEVLAPGAGHLAGPPRVAARGGFGGAVILWNTSEFDDSGALKGRPLFATTVSALGEPSGHIVRLLDDAPSAVPAISGGNLVVLWTRTEGSVPTVVSLNRTTLPASLAGPLVTVPLRVFENATVGDIVLRSVAGGGCAAGWVRQAPGGVAFAETASFACSSGSLTNLRSVAASAPVRSLAIRSASCGIQATLALADIAAGDGSILNAGACQ